MALTFDQITAITERFFVPRLVDNVYEESAALKRLKMGMELISGGHEILTPIIKSKPGSGEYFSDFDALNTSPTDDITSAAHVWKQLQEPIKMSRLQELKNNGDAAKIRLVAAKMQIAEKNIAENLSLGLFSDGTASTGANTTKQITGLRAILSTTVTYGGIAVADLAEWIAVVDTAGSNRALTLALLQKLFNAASFGSDRPSMISSNRGVFNVYWSLTQPFQRTVPDTQNNIGFVDGSFNGRPWFIDEHQVGNSVYMVNEKYVKLMVHREENLRFEKITQIESQAASLGRIFWAGNLTCNGRRYQALLEALQESV